MKRNIIRELIFYAIIIALIVVALSALLSSGNKTEAKNYGDVVTYIEKQEISEFTLTSGYVAKIVLKNGTQLSVKLGSEYASLLLMNHEEELSKQKADGVITKLDLQPQSNRMAWLSYLPMILLIIAIVVIWFISFRAMNGKNSKFNSFGRAKTKQASQNEKDKVYFRDVAGADEEKEELVEIVEFLKDPQKYTKLGARIPHGVLLVGPPGTGKTLLAKAVAGEADVPFYSISGSDFVEMYVGVGASRVRDLFENARRSPAAIIFIDEIDAVGRHRGAGLGGGHDEREQTLNQLLVEMDGFGSHEGIIVMAATNRPDILDPALLRPGRFDRQVTVNYPDIKGREEILKVHAKGKPLAPDVKLKVIAKSTAGFTGADLENLLNEAALLAARKDLKAITMKEVEEATIKVVVGTEKKSRVMSDHEKRLTAYHEAGHAIATFYCPTQDPVHQISIIPRGMAGGFTMSLPSEDKSYRSRTEMLEEIVVLLGGRVAEALIIGDISTGASNDIERATQLVVSMITKYGMSTKLGPVNYSSENDSFLGAEFGGKPYSEKTAAAIDEEVKDYITTGYAKTETILKDHTDELHRVAQFLFEHEKMSGEQFIAAVENREIPIDVDTDDDDDDESEERPASTLKEEPEKEISSTNIEESDRDIFSHSPKIEEDVVIHTVDKDE